MEQPTSVETTTPAPTTTPVSPTTTTTEPEDKSILAEESQPAVEAPAEHTPLTAEGLTFPEGTEVATEFVEEFIELANEAKLSSEVANKLVDTATRLQQAATDRLVTQWMEQQAEWLGEAQKNFGEGYEQALGKIKALNKEYGSPEAAEALFLTGAEKHPAVLQFLAKMADKLVVEGKPVQGAPGTSQRTAAQILYPNHRSA